MDETAKARVELDGQQPKNEISELREQAKALRKELRDMTAKNDLQGVKELEKKLGEINTQMGSAKKTLFDYNQVLKNLNGSSIKDLERAQSALSKEIKNTARGTDDYIKKTKQLSQVRSEIGKTRTEMGQFTTSQSNLIGLLSKGIGFIGGFYGAIKLGQSIIESADSSSDKFAVTMGGLNSAWDYFKKSIATADFSNFFSNMARAIKAGEEYAKQLDIIEDRNRAASISESATALAVAKQTAIYRDALKTKTERIAAIDEILRLEKQQVTVTNSIAVQAKNAKIDDLLKLGITEETIKKNLLNYESNKKLIEQADDYNAALSDQKDLQAAIAQSAFLQTDKLTKQKMDELSNTINSATPEIIAMAEIRSKYNKLNKEEMDELAQLYIKVNSSELAYYENTQRAASKRSQLIKEMNGDQAKNIKNDVPGLVEDPYAVVGKTLDDIVNQWIQEDLNNSAQLMTDDISETLDEASVMQLEHIKTNNEYELELYAETQRGKKDLLLKRLRDGEIAEKEYADGIKQIDAETIAGRAYLWTQFFGNLQQVFRENTLAYKMAGIAEATISTYAGAAAELKTNDVWYIKLAKIAAIISTGLAQVAKIKNVQAFSSGGYTGDGGTYEPAGIVHKGEYVIKKRQMQNPAIRGIVDTIIEPDRLSRINYESAHTSISNMRGYALGGIVTQPAPINNININTDQLLNAVIAMAQETRALREDMNSGKIRADIADRTVEKITVRQSVISKIKNSVRR